MAKHFYFILLAAIFLLLPTLTGYGQVDKKYAYTYDSSGNRNSRVPVLIAQNIDLTIGWNIFSANVLPEQRNLKTIVQPLIDAGKLIKVMDEAGKTIENLGAFGGWKNNIGDILATEGYKINVNANCTLTITGDQVALPLDISLYTGWSIISFPQTMQVDAMQVVQSLIDAGKLTKVMDELGKAIENFGAFGGWKNNIGNFAPGEGYKVNVNSPAVLTINASYAKSSAIPIVRDIAVHYRPAYIGKGFDHMNINIVDIMPGILGDGDEISAFDDKLCVGSVKVTEQKLKEGSVELIASANDDIGGLGFKKGNKFKLKLWQKATNKEYSLKFETIKGGDAFEKLESSFIRLKALEESLDKYANASKTEESQKGDETRPAILPNIDVQANSGTDHLIVENLETSLKCYPNPLTDEVTIEFFLHSEATINLSIFNSSGALVRTITDKKAGKGTNHYTWNRADGSGNKVPPGLYLCKLMVDKHYFDQKLIVK